MDKYIQLFQEIFKQPFKDETNVELLEKIIKDYPYFTPAHFFLLHFTDRDSPAFAQLAKKTTPLFNNTYWLNFQLLELKMKSGNQQSFREQDEFAKVQSAESEITATKEETTYLTVNIETDNIVASIEAEPLVEATLPSEVQLTKSPDEAETMLAVPAPEELTVVAEEPQQLKESPVADDFSAVHKSAFELVELPDNLHAVEYEPVNDETPNFTEETPGYTEAEMDANEALQNETDLPDNTDPVPDAEMEQVSVRMAETLAGLTIDRTTSEETVSFEPLHASDYFASVGIKLSEEIKPADKLGLQLKSFTEWLKTMKKVHAAQLADNSISESSQVTNDKTIQELAEASNRQNDVLTEAMADVFEQQGKTGKAIEVYEKLSLLNPSKKVYFAAKIKQLKD